MAIARDKPAFSSRSRDWRSREPYALDVFEAVAQSQRPADRRDRIEHAQLCAEDFARSELNISFDAPSHQTTHALARIASGANDRGIPLAPCARTACAFFGTDYNSSHQPFAPLCLRYRERPRRPRNGWEPQEKSRSRLLRAYTSARPTAFEEGKKGELKAGEYADFISFKRPHQDSRAIHENQVRRTVVAGRTVF